MKKLISVLCLVIVMMGININDAMAQQLAFPGAEGYGKYTTGGRGGEVCYVTRLDDCTDANLTVGTLRWALRHNNGGKPRTILFKVSGTIYLTSKLKLSYPNVSILGQSAPGGGICLAGYPLYICQNNIIVRYIRFRAGDIPNTSLTGLDMENCDNVIIDHCSMTWSMEECLTAYDTDNTTIQWCIIGEGLYNSKNSKGARAYATQWGGEHSSMLHTLITNSHSRAPRFNGVRNASTNKGDHDYKVDSEFANNVVFNWSGYGNQYGGEYDKSTVESPSWAANDPGYNRVYLISNFYRPGPSTKIGCKSARYWCAPSTPYGQWYLSGNKFEVDGTYSTKSGVWSKTELDKVNADNLYGAASGSASRGINLTGTTVSTCVMTSLPYELSGTEYETADKAYNNVVTKAGASLPRYDEVDSRLIAEAAGKQAPKYTGSLGEAGIIDSPDDIKLNNHDSYLAAGKVYNNYPSLSVLDGEKYIVDTDADGMPDAYEDAVGMNKNDANDGATKTASGYTNLEVYLNGIADGTINKADYETNDTPDIEGEQTLLTANVDGNIYSHYVIGGKIYPAGTTVLVPAGVTPKLLITVKFDFAGIDPLVILPAYKVAIPTAAKEGYTFEGWTDGTNTYTEGTTCNFSSSVTLTPKFKKSSAPVERVLYATDFTDWTKVSSSTTASKKTVTTENSNETLTFTFAETAIEPTGTNTKFKAPATTGYAMSAKTATPYFETSALNSISTVTFIHCATGSSRGWGLKVKGDGDSDWVTLSSAVANPASGHEVTVNVNRTNCQLRFYNLNSSQNAYMTNLTIKGLVNINVTLYSFSAVATDGGTITQSSTKEEYEKDSQVTVTATPNSGYLFDSWTDQNGNVVSTSQTYVHTVTDDIALTANFKSYADYAYITEGCLPYNAAVKTVSELKAALNFAASKTGTYRIFVHNGTYDLGSVAKTAIPGSTSLIGESQDGVLIMNTAPQVSSNYQDLTPTLYIDTNQDNVYLQDLTIRQARDWDAKKSQGQALAMRQRGKRAIYKNVTMQGIQDTYYLNKADASAYFETCKIAGEVDFIYGDGAMYFQECTLQPVSSGACITAPNTPTGGKGIVFNECTIEQEPSAKSNAAGYRLGRPWSDSPSATYLNTTMKILPAAAGWGSMSSGLVCRFHEYGSKDANGKLLDLSSRSISACNAASGSDNPVLTADEAATYTLDDTFSKNASGWNPKKYAAQLTASSPAINGKTLSWSAVEGALGYAIVENGSVVGFTTETTYQVSDETSKYQIRVANAKGGLGAVSAKAEAISTGITTVSNNHHNNSADYYNVCGQRVSSTSKGIVICNGKKIVKR